MSLSVVFTRIYVEIRINILYSIGQCTGSIVTLRYRIYTGYITENTVIPMLHFSVT